MSRRALLLAISTLAMGLVFLAAGPVRAGAHGAFAFCSGSPGKSYCYGTLAGFVADPDPNSYASFNTESSSTASFNAHLGGRDYGCTVSSTLYPDVVALWPRTAAFNSLFVIMWDQQGNCSSLSLHNSSAYR